MFDNQNVGSHKMTTDSKFILFFKKTNLNTSLACLWLIIGTWWWGVIFFVTKIWGRDFIDVNFCKFGTPSPFRTS